MDIKLTQSQSQTIQLSTDTGKETLPVSTLMRFSEHYSNLSSIVSEGQLNFYTSMEADLILNQLFNALSLGGQLEVTVEDTDFHARQWLEAEWDEDTLTTSSSHARLSFQGLFGAQSSGNPLLENFSDQYVDTFKSGYNRKRLTFLLERAGFSHVNVCETDQGKLVGKAVKTMFRGERQISPHLKNIRKDHINRYMFAVETLLNEDVDNVLDLACGIGYGSKLVASNTGAKVMSVDIDEGAIDYAKQYYSHPNVTYLLEDAKQLDVTPGSLDAVVSFETIEHVDFDRALLTLFHRSLRPGGILIASTPNENSMPFSKARFPFHLKHYTQQELEQLLQETGFSIVKLCSQPNDKLGEITHATNGDFLIFVAKKET